jgi:hypothetical protein
MLRAATPERMSAFSDGVFARPDRRLGPGSAAARATGIQGAPVALAYMAKLTVSYLSSQLASRCRSWLLDSVEPASVVIAR